MDELYCNFKKSLEQKYNAICLDIDGTLTAKDSKKIDERAKIGRASCRERV